MPPSTPWECSIPDRAHKYGGSESDTPLVYVGGPNTIGSTSRGSLSVLFTLLCVVSSSMVPVHVYPEPMSSSVNGAATILTPTTYVWPASAVNEAEPMTLERNIYPVCI